MGGIKKYFNKQFQKDMLFLEHENVTDFYLSCFQTNRSAVPLLCLRTIIFLGCLAILISSLVIMGTTFTYFGHWFIFLTHWGLVLNTVASGFACAMSIIVVIKGPIDAIFGLPWYVKAYWVMFNTAVPVAFFITIFYWIMLTDMEEDYAIGPVLDVFIHAMNSALMLVLVLISRHPARLLHFYCALGLGIIYMLFTVIYYFAGGLSPFGEVWIYPQLDWSQPGLTIGTTVGSAVVLVVMHALVAAISIGRDAYSRRCNRSLSISGDYD